jgi:lipid-A-disaccharide synthase-like uncharacterized protein
VVLLATIVYQVHRQWTAHDNGGVSRFLYVGQILASTGFLVYSVSVADWVFVITNALLLVTALAGIAIHARNERRAA